MSVICLIGARGGSQGLPGKNIRPLLGKPLIVWSIEQALAATEIDDVVVSTDSQEIVEVARAAGAKTPFVRPAELSGPEVGKFQVWQHALEALENVYDTEIEMLVDFDCTNPLRSQDDISGVIQQLRAGRARGVDAVFTVCEARKNPYFNMVEANKDGALKMCKNLDSTVIRRQDAPSVLDHVGSVYALTPEYLRSANHLLEGHAEGYDVGDEKRFDVDSIFDFKIVEFLLAQRLEA